MDKFETLKDDELATITLKSRHDLLTKFKKLDEVSAETFYIDILKNIKDFITVDKTHLLEHLNWLLYKIGKHKKEENLQHYFESAKTHFQNFNLIIIACRNKAIDALSLILGDKKKTLYNLSCKIHNSDISSYDLDEFNHNVFYYAIRSNNTDMLSLLIDKWPNKNLREDLEELDHLLSRSFKELKLRNVFLTTEMELCVHNEIFNIRFFHRNPNDVSSGNSIVHIKKRIELLIENIKMIKSSYLYSDPDEEFMLLAEFIVKNIHVLKSVLRSTYDKLPWEEIEFYLTIFIQFCKKTLGVNLVYNTVLKKEQILLYLEKFSHILESEKKNIENSDIKTLWKSLKLERDKVVENIIQNNSVFKNLYADYEKLRDFCSLETIQHYTDLANSADVSKLEGKLLIIRALQVTGEHTKMKLYTPKLSGKTARLLLYSLPSGTRKVIEKLRDSLSHGNYSVVQSEIENNSFSFFKDIQIDMSKVNSLAAEILSEIKTEQIEKLLLNLKNCKYWKDVKDLLEIYSFSYESIVAEIKKLDFSRLIKSDSECLWELLESFYNLVGEKRPDEDMSYRGIYSAIQYEKEEFRNRKEEITSIFYKLHNVYGISQVVDCNDVFNFDLLSCDLEVTDISTAYKKNYAGELAIQLLQSILPRIPPGNNEIWKKVWQMFYLIEFQMGNVKWIKEFADILYLQKEKKVYSKEVQMQHVLFSKISTLETILKENDLLDSLLTSNLSFFEKNRKLQAIIEMLELDICSLLEDYCTYNNFFLDNDYTLQTGHNLRNNLAHMNALINDLSPSASQQVLLNARKLATENFVDSDKKIGQVEKCDSHKLETTHSKNLFIIRNQRELFVALSEGNMDNVRKCIKKGADIFGKDKESRSCLHFSSQAPNIEAMEYCLKQGLDINSKSSKDETALHTAAKLNRLKIVEYLLKKGVSVSSRNAQGLTPLHIAAENNSQDVVKYLLEHKAQTSVSVFPLPPLHYAIYKGSIEAAKILLDNEPNVDKIKSHGGFTALYTAAEKGDPYLVKLLMEKNARVDARDDFENTPLHVACLKSHLDVVEILISKGADINAKNIEGNTPLHNAAKNGKKSTAKFLLHHGADIYAKNYHFYIPLHYAAKNGHLDIAELFLKTDSNLVHAINYLRQTPLHFAACKGHTKLVNLLLKFNAIIDSKENTNATALHISLCNGHLEVIQSLIEKGADIEVIGTAKKCKPLHLASHLGNVQIVELLTSKGADIHSRDASVQATPLVIAALRRHKDVVKLLVAKGADFREIFKLGTDPVNLTIFNALSELLLDENIEMNLSVVENLEPILLLAGGFGHQLMIKFCLEKGCYINARNEFGSTALHLAAISNHQEVVTFLLENGADINAEDSEGNTALFLAAKHNAKETVCFLLNKKTEITRFSTNGINTSLYLAVLSGHASIVDVLFKECEFDILILQEKYDFLHRASQFGHRKVVETLLKEGFKIDAPWCSLTPLHHAAVHNRCEIARLLISRRANVNAQDAEGKTPLHLIVEGDSIEMLEILLNGGADISLRNNKNQSVVEVAVSSNRLEIIKHLTQKQDININSIGMKGFSLLHIAAEIGSLEITEYLTLRGANINAKDMNDSKPIHIAAQKSHKAIVEFYLNKNIGVNDLGHQDFTPLHFSALDDKINVCELLIQRGADVNAFAKNGMTPIHLAVFNDSGDVFRILLHNGAYYNTFDVSSSSKLAEIENESIKCVLKIIEKLFIAIENNDPLEVEHHLKEVDHHPMFSIVNVRCVTNETPLLRASREGYKEIVDLLLKFKANPNIGDKQKLMPLHYAARFSHLKIVKTLLMNGAIYNAPCLLGKSPLKYATDQKIVNLLRFASKVFTKIKNKNESVLKDLKMANNEEFSKLLLRAKDLKGNTLVTAAILSDFPKTEQLKALFQDDIIHQWKLVDTLNSQQNYLEASGKLKIILDRRIEIFGEESPATLDVQEGLVRAYLNQQKNGEALDLLQEIHQKRKCIFSEYHKETLVAKHLMALVFRRQGKIPEAFELFKEILKYKNVFEKSHVDLSYAEMETSLILAGRGDFLEALKMVNDVLDKSNEVFGTHHKITLDVQNNKAAILQMQGNFLEAKEIFEKVYNFRKNRLPCYHMDVLKSLSSVGRTLCQLKKYDEAHKIFKDIQKILKRHYPPNHVFILTNESDIAMIFLELGMKIKALKMFLTVELKITKLEASHPLVQRNKKEVESVLFRLMVIDCQWMVEKIRMELKQDEERRIALHTAIANGEREKINILLDNKTDIFMDTNEGDTALHLASAKGYDDIVEMIFNHTKRWNPFAATDLANAKNSTLSTALHLVSNVKIAKTLLKHGAIYNDKNAVGQTPLDLVRDEKVFDLLQTIDDLFNDVRNGNRRVLKRLNILDHDEVLAAANARNSQDQCLLQVAIANHQKDIAREILNWLKKITDK
ncbi:uncharacterized protein LOC129972127 isoform X1 [Argiope bruennichi]|uniref:uncharacterized protein LOC129972127 isoform X1 n=1 Tax=Argiope bruennichi TaxID=94029 RepID=UPI002494C708|nr:uncharacterized protein LOC129972127 isoform X1 [Argiope bruennichi]